MSPSKDIRTQSLVSSSALSPSSNSKTTVPFDPGILSILSPNLFYQSRSPTTSGRCSNPFPPANVMFSCSHLLHGHGEHACPVFSHITGLYRTFITMCHWGVTQSFITNSIIVFNKVLHYYESCFTGVLHYPFCVTGMRPCASIYGISSYDKIPPVLSSPMKLSPLPTKERGQ